MVLDKRIYTAGEFGGIDYVLELMRKNKCHFEYFVYKTDNPEFLLNIGNFSMLKKESESATILGIGATKADALKIVNHIITNTLL